MIALQHLNKEKTAKEIAEGQLRDLVRKYKISGEKALENDMKYYEFSKDKICNIIIQRLGFENTQSLHKKVVDNTSILNFNLNEKNTELFDNIFALSKEKIEREFFRRIFSTYVNFHPFLKEKILNTELFQILENAIKNKHKLKNYYEKSCWIFIL